MKNNLLLGMDSACLFNLSLDHDTSTLRQGYDILHPHPQALSAVVMDACLQDIKVKDMVHLNENQQLALKRLIHKYVDIFFQITG